MGFSDWLFGAPLASWEDREQRMGIAAGVPTFGLDALSSAAYGPEAALTLLIPAGMAGVAYIVPLSLTIILLLAIVFTSYWQTIAAYPKGGGSYTVASENLGRLSGVSAAAALIVDYVLDVAVGISAGVGALVSAVPGLQHDTVAICLGILLLLTLINLRGVREAGVAFMAPTFLFVGCLLVVIGRGLWAMMTSGGHPHAVVAPPSASAAHAVEAVSAWLLIRAFAGGCTALTGVEAVSNGVSAFHEPTAPTAQRTLGVIVALLAILLAGIAVLVRAYHIVATPPGSAHYQSVLAMLTAAVAGRGWFFYVTVASILLVLSLSANTAFAGFPRLCRIVAEGGFLPSFFALRGRRLVYNVGIFVLAVLAGILIMAFGGVTDRLIPLFAIGAFLAFTLSQAGMVVHWKRKRGRHWHRNLIINGVGAIATGVTVLIVLVAKFTEGAWITALVIPALIWMMVRVKREYERIERAVHPRPLKLDNLQPPLAVVPIAGWNVATENALRFACMMTPNVHVVHIHSADEHLPTQPQWQSAMAKAAAQAGIPAPQLDIVESPYRFVIGPILDYVLKLEHDTPDREIAIIVPEIVARRWQHFLLHNHHATALKAMLLLKGSSRTVVINVPWYIKKK
ncbi:MAG TPA: APC family permease [Terriglobales bacterium]|nr:APC family permease [Terriglobales bacterium]